MSDNGQGTTTQGQSIPTAEFDKMFGKDKGMPGQDELLSTMQDRSELSASEARWNRCVTPQIAQLARVDVTLHTVLQLWRRDMSRSFQMVAAEYLKTGANLAEMAGKVGIGVDVWARAWPKWPENSGAIRRTEQEVIAIAQCVIVEAAIFARDVMRAMGEMMKLKIPEPIKVTREQAIALGFNLEADSKAAR